MDSKINELDERMTALESNINKVCQSLDRIENALKGDSDYGVLGMHQKVKDNQQAIEQLQDFRKKVVYYAAGAAGGATGIVQFILSFM